MDAIEEQGVKETSSRVWFYQIKSVIQENPNDVDLVVSVMNRDLGRYIRQLQDRLETTSMEPLHLPSQWLADVDMLDASTSDSSSCPVNPNPWPPSHTIEAEQCLAQAGAAAVPPHTWLRRRQTPPSERQNVSSNRACGF